MPATSPTCTTTSRTLRRTRLSLATAAVGLTLAACGSGGDPGAAGGGSAAPSAAAGESGSAFPVTLDSEFGTTTVDAAPERVVALGITDVDALLALDVVPVALQQFVTDYPSGVGPWSQEALGDATPEVLTSPEVDLEQVASLRPDLVVAVQAGIDQATFDQLSQLAPVVARPAGTIPYGVSMEDQTLTIARAVGQEERGEELVAAVEEEFAAAREANRAFATSAAAVGAAFPGVTYYAYTADDARSRFLTSLGLERPEGLAAVEADAFTVQLSPEQLDVLESDVLVMLDYSQEPGAVTANPQFAGLDVVSRGDVLLVEPDPVGNALSYSTVTSIPFALERVVPELATALED